MKQVNIGFDAEWLIKLNYIAAEKSEERGTICTAHDLIREAVQKQYKLDQVKFKITVHPLTIAEAEVRSKQVAKELVAELFKEAATQPATYPESDM